MLRMFPAVQAMLCVSGSMHSCEVCDVVGIFFNASYSSNGFDDTWNIDKWKLILTDETIDWFETIYYKNLEYDRPLNIFIVVCNNYFTGLKHLNKFLK